jgi:hypothetical protein
LWVVDAESVVLAPGSHLGSVNGMRKLPYVTMKTDRVIYCVLTTLSQTDFVRPVEVAFQVPRVTDLLYVCHDHAARC